MIALLQTNLMTLDRCVVLTPRKDCDPLLLFKQVAPDRLSCLDLYLFTGLFALCCKQFLLSRFLNMVAIIASLLTASFPSHFPTLPGVIITLFELYLYRQRHKNFAILKGIFLITHTCRQNNLPSWQHVLLQYHARWEILLSLVVNIYIW